MFISENIFAYALEGVIGVASFFNKTDDVPSFSDNFLTIQYREECVLIILHRKPKF